MKKDDTCRIIVFGTANGLPLEDMPNVEVTYMKVIGDDGKPDWNAVAKALNAINKEIRDAKKEDNADSRLE